LDATAASMSSPWRLRRHMPQKETGIRPRPQPSAVHCGGEEGGNGVEVSVISEGRVLTERFSLRWCMFAVMR